MANFRKSSKIVPISNDMHSNSDLVESSESESNSNSFFGEFSNLSKHDSPAKNAEILPAEARIS